MKKCVVKVRLMSSTGGGDGDDVRSQGVEVEISTRQEQQQIKLLDWQGKSRSEITQEVELERSRK